jgi:hypothetical protein
MRQWGLFDFVYISWRKIYIQLDQTHYTPFFLEKILYMPSRTLETVIIEGKPGSYEDLNVHAVYDEIAPHFASTRYKVR